MEINQRLWNGMVYADFYTFVLNSIILGGVFLTFLLKEDQQTGQRITSSVDVDVLLLLAALGGMVMVASSNLILLFLGFELLSVSVYSLTGLARKERASAEGALKYFILGSFSSAFMLYGMVLIYAATGTMEISLLKGLVSATNPMLLVGMGLMIFGLGFKVSLVPFHFWTPDAYQGAPTVVTAFMAVVVKAAAFGAFFRLMVSGFGSIQEVWVGTIWMLAVITMTVGNLLALRQTSIKRMLAYSSIAHAGYALMAFLATAGSAGAALGGGGALLFYLMGYSLMTVGAFGVVLIATNNSAAQYDQDDINSLSGLGWSHPLLGITMVISMLSLAGIPPLAGFMGKFYIFSAAINAGYVGLAIIAALNSLVSLYYYLRILVVMYFGEKRTQTWSPAENIGFGPRLALMLSVLGTIYLGIFSTGFYAVAVEAVKHL